MEVTYQGNISFMGTDVRDIFALWSMYRKNSPQYLQPTTLSLALQFLSIYLSIYLYIYIYINFTSRMDFIGRYEGLVRK